MNCSFIFNDSLEIGRYCKSPELEKISYVIGSIGLVVVTVPTFSLGGVILPALVKDKQGNKAINAVFIAITVICLISVIPSILFDISLLSDYPTFFSCTPIEYALQSCITSIFIVLVLLLNLFLAIVFYASVRSTGRSFCSLNVVRVVIILIVVFSVAQAIAFVSFIAKAPAGLLTVRGSFCVVYFENEEARDKISVVVSVLFLAIPFLLSVLFTVLTFWKVLNTLVELDKQVVHSMLLFLIAMLAATCITRIPPFLIQMLVTQRDFGEQGAVVCTLVGIFILQLQVPILLSLLFALNKGVRNFTCKGIVLFCRLFRYSDQIYAVNMNSTFKESITSVEHVKAVSP